jgi:Lipocalin-like domain
MKKRSFSIFSILVLSLLIITGCQKNDDPVVKTKTDLLATGTWKFSVAMVGSTDVTALLQACQKDNVLTFVAAGSGTVDEGATKCNMADPQTNPFTWNFASSESVLHVSTVLFTGGSSDFTLVTLTETQLVVSQMITVSGTAQTAVVTFIH